jgi:predicted acetyltransferase
MMAGHSSWNLGTAALVSPTAALRESYRSLVAEFVAAGEKLVPFVLSFDHADFEAMLARLDDCARGIGVPPGFVAHSTYWLVHDGAVVGVSNIRHGLTPSLRREGGHIGYGIRPAARRRGFATEILRQSLGRARALGIDEALVTCSKANVASARAIQRNGGVLASEEYLPERGEILQRWLVDSRRARPLEVT